MAHAITTSGALTQDGTWSGKVTLTGDVTVPGAFTLTILPGTTVVFPSGKDDTQGGADSARTELIVYGSLVAAGTASQPIIFTSNALLFPAKGDWGGIQAPWDLGFKTFQLEYYKIEYSAWGIRWGVKSGLGTFSVKNSTIRKTSGDGVGITVQSGANGSIEFTGNTVTDMSGRGFTCDVYNSNTTITASLTGNTIDHCTDRGVYFHTWDWARADVSAESNTVHDDGSNGIEIYYDGVYDAGTCTFGVKNNTIYSSATGIALSARSAAVNAEITGNDVSMGAQGIAIYGWDWYTKNVNVLVKANNVYSNANRGTDCRHWGGDSKIYPTVTGNNIYSNADEGVYFEYGSGNIVDPLVTLNSIHDNGARGILCQTAYTAKVVYNDIYNNISNGVYIQGGDGSTVTSNNIRANNGSYELENANGSRVKARCYYWGDSATSEMNKGSNPKNITRIYDIYDNTGLGEVDYTQWLSAPLSIPTSPASKVTYPAAGSTFKSRHVDIQGVAAAPSGVSRVEVSTDNGTTWHEAQGKEVWTFGWDPSSDGSYPLLSRVTDKNNQVESPGTPLVVTVNNTLPTTVGTLTQNETWQDEVALTGDVTVPQGLTLTIQPGTVIKFQALTDDLGVGNSTSRTELVINGLFSAEGTEANPIRFTSTAAAPSKDDWGGIRVLVNSADQEIKLSYCTIEYGSSGLAVSTSTFNPHITIRNATIRHTGGDGLNIYGDSGAHVALDITDSVFYDNSGRGVYVYVRNSGSSLTGTIDQNTLYNNGDAGFYSDIRNYATGSLTATGNTVHDNSVYGNAIGIAMSVRFAQVVAEITGNEVNNNGSDGIQCVRGNTIEPLITLNSIHDNSGRGIYCNADSPVRINFNSIQHNTGIALYNDSSSSIDARYNYWGATLTEEMVYAVYFKNMSGIWDIFDDGSKGTVDYTHWLGSDLPTLGSLQSRISDPVSGDYLDEGSYGIRGVAYARDGIATVQVSLDGGITWKDTLFDSRYAAKSLWSFVTDELSAGAKTILSRVVDRNSLTEIPGDQISLSIRTGEPTTQGALVHNETWTGTVRLEGDVTVPEGVTLTVLPGTVLQIPAMFDSTYGGSNTSKTEIVVNGTLIAQGTEDQPIVFTSNSQNPKKGDWSGIQVNGSISIKYATIEYANYGIALSANSNSDWLSVSNCTIRYSLNDGINIYADSSASIVTTIENSAISDNGGSGVYIRSYQADTTINASISGNTISNNGSVGIYCISDGAWNSRNTRTIAAISDNTVFGNGSQGIYGYALNSGRTDLTIDHNTVHHSGTGIYIYTNSGYNNSWTSTMSLINNATYSNIKGIAIYSENTSISPVLSNNTIHDNTSDGLNLNYGAWGSHVFTPQITGNQVFKNAGNGIYMRLPAAAALANNGLYGNTGYDLYNDSGSTVDARSNWWGVDTTNTIAAGPNPKNLAKIYDSFDNSSVGTVDYSQWLTLYEVPATPSLNPVASPTTLASVVLSGTKDAGTSVVINGSETVPQDNASAWSCTLLLSEGTNTFSVYTRNLIGMASEAIVAKIVKDTTAPIIFSSVPTAGAYVKRPVEYVDMTLVETGTQIDTDATLAGATALDGNREAISGQWTINFNHVQFIPFLPLSEGAYTFTIHPTDTQIGNTRTAAISFTIDMTSPSIFTINEVTTPTNVASQVISGTKETGTSILMDGVQIVSANDNTDWSCTLNLSEGANSHSFASMDRAGNVSVDVPLSIILDRTAPTLVSTEPANRSFVMSAPDRVVFHFTDQTTSLDAAATIATASIMDFSGQAVAGTWSVEQTNDLIFTPMFFLEGIYTASVQAKDLAGNASSWSMSFTFDVTPPAAPTLDPVTTPTNFAYENLSGTKDANASIWINGTQAVPVNGGNRTRRSVQSGRTGVEHRSWHRQESQNRIGAAQDSRKRS